MICPRRDLWFSVGPVPTQRPASVGMILTGGARLLPHHYSQATERECCCCAAGGCAATLPACRSRLPPVSAHTGRQAVAGGDPPNPPNPLTSPCPSRRPATQSVLLPHRRTCPVRSFVRSLLPSRPSIHGACCLIAPPIILPIPSIPPPPVVPFPPRSRRGPVSSKSKSFLLGSRRAFPPSPNPHLVACPRPSKPCSLPPPPLSAFATFEFHQRF